ncbi:MAG: hypothetical protein NDI94_07095 [Candidatus Woesearchaeota archaeon]|nr:hypothetical protein [Candidatus Woesearchaeota archaeon]
MKPVYFSLLGFESAIPDNYTYHDMGYVDDIVDGLRAALAFTNQPTTDEYIVNSGLGNIFQRRLTSYHLGVSRFPQYDSRSSILFYLRGDNDSDILNRAFVEARAICHLGLREEFEAASGYESFIGVSDSELCKQAVNYVYSRRGRDAPSNLFEPFNVDEESIHEIMSKYEYGQFNLASGNFKIRYDKANRKVYIDNFYCRDPKEPFGTCGDLASKVSGEIRQLHPNYPILAVNGFEPVHFYHVNDNGADNHVFLLLFDSHHIGIDFSNPIEQVYKEITQFDPIVIDPSYRLMKRLSESGYVLNPNSDKSSKRKKSNTVELDSDTLAPLGFDSYGSLVSIGVSDDPIEILSIKISGKGSLFYSLSPELLSFPGIRNSRLMPVIEALLKKEIEYI